VSDTERFVQKLEELKHGSRWRLRHLACRPLDQTVLGFDLFTGLWWPLREQSRAAPRRETSWLVAKLYGAFRVPHVPGQQAILPHVLGRCEPRDEYGRTRFRARFDALLQSPLASLEPHLRWALFAVEREAAAGRASGVDWAQLLDDLSAWDRGDEHRRRRPIPAIWAEQYLNAVNPIEREDHHADRDSYDPESQPGKSQPR
jgi:hypothetical protein